MVVAEVPLETVHLAQDLEVLELELVQLLQVIHLENLVAQHELVVLQHKEILVVELDMEMPEAEDSVLAVLTEEAAAAVPVL